MAKKMNNRELLEYENTKTKVKYFETKSRAINFDLWKTMEVSTDNGSTWRRLRAAPTFYEGYFYRFAHDSYS